MRSMLWTISDPPWTRATSWSLAGREVPTRRGASCHVSGQPPDAARQSDFGRPGARLAPGAGGLRAEGHTDRRHRLIVLRAGLEPEAERRALLHEMCHAAAGWRDSADRHGSLFQEQLNHLASQGETWAIHEASVYADPLNAIGRQDVLEAVASLAFECGRLPWRSAQLRLAHDFGFSLRELPIRVRDWRRLCRRAGNTPGAGVTRQGGS